MAINPEKMVTTTNKDAVKKSKTQVSTPASSPNTNRLQNREPAYDHTSYESSTPTARELLARIGRVGQSNPERGQEMFSLYNESISDRNSPIWNPYAAPTNTGAIEALTAMGVDLSGGITQERINQLKQYADYTGHVGVSGAPLAPTKTSTDAQNLAYWLYQLDKDEKTTQQAETEWADLQKYISDQVALGLADDEILEGIKWSNYKTLTGMDDNRKLGVPTQLNRAVGYSEDALYGALWAARNPETASDDMMANAAQYVLGSGTMNKKAAEKPYDPSKDVTNYAGYAPWNQAGGTFNKYAEAWGVDEIDFATMNQHRDMLNDPDTAKEWNAMYDALDRTEAAKREWADLQADIQKMRDKGRTPEEIWERIQRDFDNGEYSTLDKLEESRVKGKPLDLLGEFNFSMPGLRTLVFGEEKKPKLKGRLNDIASEATQPEPEKGFLENAWDTVKGIFTADDSGTEVFENSGTLNNNPGGTAPKPVAAPEMPTTEPAATAPERKLTTRKKTAKRSEKTFTSAMNKDLNSLLRGGSANGNKYAENWYNEFGYLLGGEVMRANDVGGGMTAYDSREVSYSDGGQTVKNEMAKPALDALKVDEAGERDGYVTTDTRIEHARAISEDIEAARAEGISLDEYYKVHPDATEKFGAWEAEAQKAGEALAAERNAAQQQAEAERKEYILGLYDGTVSTDELPDAYAKSVIENSGLGSIAINDSSYEQAALEIKQTVQRELGWDVFDDLEDMGVINPELDGQFADMSGAAKEGHYASSVIPAVTDMALESINRDARYAAALGMTLSEFYEAGYGEQKDAKELAQDAVKQFNAMMGGQNAADMVNEILAAYEATQVPQEAQGEVVDDDSIPTYDISKLETIGRGVQVGTWQYINGKLTFVGEMGRGINTATSKMMYGAANDYIYAQARNLTRSEYASAIQTSIDKRTTDPDFQQYWTERLNNWEGDIYNIGYDLGAEEIETAIANRQAAIDESTAIVMKNGSEFEKSLFSTTSSLTNNLELMAESTLLGKLTGAAGVAELLESGGHTALATMASIIPTTMSYGMADAGETARGLREKGVDADAALAWGLGQAIATGWMEEKLGIDKMLGKVAGKSNSAAMQFMAGVLDEDDIHSLGMAGIMKNIQKNGWKDTMKVVGRMWGVTGLVEGSQELFEGIEKIGYDTLSEAISSPEPRSIQEILGDNVRQSQLLEEFKQGAFQGVLLSMIGADFGLATGSNYVYDNAAHAAAVANAEKLLHYEQGSMTDEQIFAALDSIINDYRVNPTLAKDLAMEFDTAMVTVDQITNGALSGIAPEQAENARSLKRVAKEARTAVTEAQKTVDDAATAQARAEQAVTSPGKISRRAARINLEAATDALVKAKADLETKQQAATEAETNYQTAQAQLDEMLAGALSDLRNNSAQVVAAARGWKSQQEKEAEQRQAAQQQAIEAANTNPESAVAQTAAEVAQAEQEYEKAQAELDTYDTVTGRRRRGRQAEAARQAQANATPTQVTTETKSAKNSAEVFAQATEATTEATTEAAAQTEAAQTEVQTAPVTQTEAQTAPATQTEAASETADPVRAQLESNLAAAKERLDAANQAAAEQAAVLDKVEATQSKDAEIKSILDQMADPNVIKDVARYKELAARLDELRGDPNTTEAVLKDAVQSGTLSDSDAEAIAKAHGVEMQDKGYTGKPGLTNQVKPEAWAKRNSKQNAQATMLDALAKKAGVEIILRETMPVNGFIVNGTNRIYVAMDAMADGIVQTGMHEMTHFIAQNSPDGFADLRDFVKSELIDAGYDWDGSINARIEEYAAQGQTLTDQQAIEEIIAESMGQVFTNETVLARFKNEHRGAFERIKDWFKNFWQTLTDIARDYAGATGHDEVFALVGNNTALQQMYDLFIEAADDAKDQYTALVSKGDTKVQAEAGVTVSEKGIAYADSDTYSLRTIANTDYVKERDKAAADIAVKLGVTEQQAQKWIDNLTTISAMIALDKARLDFEAEENYDALKSNQEYIYTIDFSTLCKKRLWFTGTFDAIQSQLADARLNEDDYVVLRQMMADRGYEVACAFCYVESRRKNNGKVIGQFLDAYQKAVDTNGQITIGKKNPKYFTPEAGFIPTIADFNTTEGASNIMHNHPEVWEAYKAFMNHKGVSKPKLIENRTDYEQSILTTFQNARRVASFNERGGLRLQSFSDFEAVNLLDMMQVVTDMARVKLKSQAYTKVPNFAKVFGTTGVKINLSLVADGVDADGNLIFNDIEGMPAAEAFAIRDGSFLDSIEMDDAERQRLKALYSKNVGTILVGADEATIRAAMADPRIDFIIPYHRSGWSNKNQKALGISGYEDHSKWQNEKSNNLVWGKDKDGNPKLVKESIENFYPNQYWKFGLTGDQNAEIYLQMCRDANRTPKFPQFAGEPGYWKMLIDFKMYDNDGIGAPQMEVTPEVNMTEAQRVLNEYEGGHESLPRANDVVDDFLAYYIKKHPNAKLTPGWKAGGENRSYSLKTGREVQSEEKSFKELFDSLGVVETIGRNGFARNGERTYDNTRSHTVHTLDPQDGVALSRAVANQLNHRLRLSEIGSLDTELTENYLMQNPNSLPGADRAAARTDALAEFTRLWLYDQAAARQLGGTNFTDEFERRLRDRGYMPAMQKAQTELTLYANTTAAERIKSRLDMDAIRNRSHITARAAETKLADRTYPLQRVTDLMRSQFGEVHADSDPRTLMLANANRGQNFVDYCLEDHLVDPEGNRIDDRSLQTILNKVGRANEKDFNAYWIALHSLDRINTGKEVLGMTKTEIESAIRELDGQHPEFAALVDEAIDWYDKFMQAWVVNTGMMSQKDYDHMRELYPHYIPTYRTDYRTGDTRGRQPGQSGSTNGIVGATGSTRDIYNPVMGLAENVQRLIANYRNAEIGRAFVDAIRRTTDNGDIAELIQTPKMDQYVEEFEGDGLTHRLTNLSRDTFAMSGDNILTVTVADGERVSVKINDPLIAEALLHSEPKRLGRIFDSFRKVKQLITATSTALSLGFSVPNVLSDFGTAFMTGSFAATPVDGVLKWLAAAGEYAANTIKDKTGKGTQSSTYEAYKLFGSLNSRFNMRDHNTVADMRQKMYGGNKTLGDIVDAFHKSPILGVASAVAAPVKGAYNTYVGLVEDINDVLENATRFAEFKYGKHDTSTYEGRIEAGHASREVTTNFSKTGTSESLAIARSVVPFLGATIEGVNKSIMLPSSDNYGRRKAILAKAGEVVALGVMMALYRNNMWDDDDKEMYGQLQDDYKMKYYVIPIPGTQGQFIRIKKSQDMMYLLADQLGEFIGNYSTGNGGNPFDDVTETMWNLLKSTTDITTIFDPIIDAKANTTWYDTPIENYSMTQLPVTERYKADTSPLWKGMSELLNGFGVEFSPLKCEYVARQYLGSYGTILGKTLREMSNGTLTAESFGQIVRDRLLGRLTIDGATANQASNIFYDGYDFISGIEKVAKGSNKSISSLRYDLTESEFEDAVDAAKSLRKELDGTKDIMNELWADYNDTEDEEEQREIRIQIMRAAMEANDLISDYRAQYCYANQAEQALWNTVNLWTDNKVRTDED